MRVGSRRFSIPLWALCLYLVTVSCMLLLGRWQLNRAEVKVNMQQAVEQSAAAKPVSILDIQNFDDAAARYQKVSVSGEYLPDRHFLWDNRTHKSRAGFEVISMLRLESGKLALVNRGWVPLGASRENLPNVDLPEDVSDVVTLEGFLSTPSKGLSSGEAIELAGQWPGLLQYLDYPAIERQTGEPVLPVLVQAQAVWPGSSEPVVLTPRPEWYTPNWHPSASGPAKHYSYAFQWFAMAAALTILLFVVNRQKQQRGLEQ
ncbi:MAG: SURF1 family protein [Granulosicoccus sp.]